MTQRGNARQAIFQSDSDRLVYLDLLQRECRLRRLLLVGYCLMPNHVHLIAVPERSDSLPLVLKNVHGRYAAYFNARLAKSGHLWQGRYYSCPLGSAHLWNALRYAELNPVRAGMVSTAVDYAWSSAAVHCGLDGGSAPVDLRTWGVGWWRVRAGVRGRWGSSGRRRYCGK